MKKEQRIKEIHILKNNQLMPVVVSALAEDDFLNKRLLRADIDEQELYSASLFDAFSFEDKQTFLLIIGIDELYLEEQEKFISLLKNRRLGGKKLPDTIQIVLLVKDKKKVSSKVMSYCLG